MLKIIKRKYKNVCGLHEMETRGGGKILDIVVLVPERSNI